ncbi:hypothetical protein QO010_004040 [Caulobacter ginsengisoli]|uniref:DUF3631 domain-containing protein n=1 Tax=Caulobacter ginsengisoli TaxID=400775 RepID=A0ABU0IZ50_9CAUL|nr:hypothetical protein [Caulobacter ginsengisoli]MDQ0466247.1 hypothetical protein [Caulobacter ginsengisoli]
MSLDNTAIPTISRVLDDGTLIELLFDPANGTTAFAVARPDGHVSIESQVELPKGERLIPYSASNNLIVNDCVLLPSDVGDFMEKGDVLGRVQTFIHRYVDLPETFERIAAHYVLLSWVYDAFSDLPYLRFRGDFGTGKTRALLTIGSLCYKSFLASGASTVSPIFHIQDAFQGTLVLDEADFRFSDATTQLTKVLNNGTTRGMPVLRTMANRNRELNPQAFRVFGPKLIAMREQFSDLALESRFLTVETSGRTLRTDVPIHLPESFKREALQLRNLLLAWRLRSRFSTGPDPSRAALGVAPRYRQTSLALLSLVDDADLRAQICRELAGEEARGLQERADTLEAAMLTAISETFAASPGPHAAIKDVADRFNALAAEELGRPMSNKWIGGFVRRRLRLLTIKTSGVYAVPQTEKAKCDALARRFGLPLPPDISTSGSGVHAA